MSPQNLHIPELGRLQDSVNLLEQVVKEHPGGRYASGTKQELEISLQALQVFPFKPLW